MKITIIGTGCVGLVTGACFAETENQVSCIDVDEQKIQKLQRNEIPFYEPGLLGLVSKNQTAGRLTFSTNLPSEIQSSSIVFICIGTSSKKDGSTNLDQIFDVARKIAENANSIIVAVKSTVPVGTSHQLEKIFLEMNKPGIQVVSNPEFLRESSAVEDCFKPDRIVIGTNSTDAFKKFQELYKPFVKTGNPIMMMDHVSAETAKYASNCILATRISFINEMSMLCEKTGANISKVLGAVGADHRIGSQYLSPSVGFGGSCFSKDVRAAISLFRDNEMRANVLEATLLTNEQQKNNFCKKIKNFFLEQSLTLDHKKIAIWGAAFKAMTDDIRESPALDVIDFLIKEEASVFVYDPKANQNIAQMYGRQVTCLEDPYEVLNGAFALCILTEWDQFKHPDFSRMADKLSRKVIFDGRNLYDPEQLKELGFSYHSIGRS